MGRHDKFEPTMYVTAYELARDGLSDEQIAKSIGVVGLTFRRWCKRKPALADAVSRGRYRRDPQDTLTFHEYVFNHLSEHLQGLWKEINACEELENGVERIEALLKNKGIRVRQHLFLYALTQSMFNTSAALRKVGISRKTFSSWRENDPTFAELVDEIHWHKENFFEQAFIGRVAAGDTAAVIHAVKTKCRSRGYNEKIEVEHTGTISHRHTVSVAELDLPLDTRKQILEAVRKHQAAQDPSLPTNRLQVTGPGTN
jgi:hypothetical protein